MHSKSTAVLNHNRKSYKPAVVHRNFCHPISCMMGSNAYACCVRLHSISCHTGSSAGSRDLKNPNPIRPIGCIHSVAIREAAYPKIAGPPWCARFFVTQCCFCFSKHQRFPNAESRANKTRVLSRLWCHVITNIGTSASRLVRDYKHWY